MVFSPETITIHLCNENVEGVISNRQAARAGLRLARNCDNALLLQCFHNTMNESLGLCLDMRLYLVAVTIDLETVYSIVLVSQRQ